MQKEILHNQSLFDVAVQYCGTVAAYLDIAKLNGLSPTAILSTGDTIKIPEKDYGAQDIVDYYKYKGIIPATAVTTESENQELDYQFPQLLPLL